MNSLLIILSVTKLMFPVPNKTMNRKISFELNEGKIAENDTSHFSLIPWCQEGTGCNGYYVISKLYKSYCVQL